METTAVERAEASGDDVKISFGAAEGDAMNRLVTLSNRVASMDDRLDTLTRTQAMLVKAVNDLTLSLAAALPHDVQLYTDQASVAAASI